MRMRCDTVNKILTFLIGVLVFTLYFTITSYGDHCKRHEEEWKKQNWEDFNKNVDESLRAIDWSKAYD